MAGTFSSSLTSLLMFSNFRSTQVRALGLSMLLFLGSYAASAQNRPTALVGYDFLTVTAMESGAKSLAKVLITPAFQGKTEIQLEDFGGFSTDKNMAKLQHNTELINQELSALTTAGWELVQTYPFGAGQGAVITRYLFRKAKS